jgi:two-component system response regulator RegA
LSPIVVGVYQCATGLEQRQRTLLIVDDDAPFRAALAAAFARRGYRVFTAGSAEEALWCAEREAPDRAILDMRMPGVSGIDLLRELVRRFPSVAVVVLTGYGSIPTAIEAVKRGAVNYLTKPAEPGEIEAAFAEENEGIEVAPHADTHVPSLDRAAWEHLQRVLTDTGGNISEAARRLGMHRRTLQRKLQKYPPKR